MALIHLADWVFSVDSEATGQHTLRCSEDHCLCAYCRNFYEAVDIAHPALRSFLARFGITLEGPSELMPLEPTLMAACYRVTGRILHFGKQLLHVNGVPIRPETADGETFFLWVGEMELPWIQEEDPADVLSPANQPEFLERMAKKVLQWYPDSEFLS